MDKKVQIYYLPEMPPGPGWCWFGLDLLVIDAALSQQDQCCAIREAFHDAQTRAMQRLTRSRPAVA